MDAGRNAGGDFSARHASTGVSRQEWGPRQAPGGSRSLRGPVRVLLGAGNRRQAQHAGHAEVGAADRSHPATVFRGKPAGNEERASLGDGPRALGLTAALSARSDARDLSLCSSSRSCELPDLLAFEASLLWSCPEKFRDTPAGEPAWAASGSSRILCAGSADGVVCTAIAQGVVSTARPSH